MNAKRSTPRSAAGFPLGAALGALLGARALLGAVLIFTLLPVCLDDHFRVFHAAWWWENPTFTSSYQWLPGFLYVYGPLVGLTQDTVFAPRLLTLVLHLGALALIAADVSEERGTRWLAVAWLAFAPLPLVLGTVPLTETLGLLSVIGGIVMLRRWSATGDPTMLLPAAVLMLMSSMLRYELWALLPLFTFFALVRRPVRMLVTARVLAFLPWLFPLVWTALLWAVEGAPFSYLAIVRDDHLGAGSLLESLSSPSTWSIPAQVIIGVPAAGIAAVACLRRRKAPAGLVWEAYALAAGVLLAAFLVVGEVPSQYPERMLLWCLAFSAIPAARLAGGMFRPATRTRLLLGAGVGAVMLAASAVYIGSLPLGIPRGDFEAGLVLRESFARGHLTDDDHVVIEHMLPESTAPYVYSNRPRNVHIDALGNLCPFRLLSRFPSICQPPRWSSRVRLVLAHDPRTVEALITVGWSVQAKVGKWFFVYRNAGAAPLPLTEPVSFEDLAAQ